MRGISTTPIVLVLIIFGVFGAVAAYSWYYASMKAAEKAALFNAKLAEEQQKCLSAVAGPNGTVLVGGAQYSNYTGLGCYVDEDVVVVLQWTRR